MLSFALPKSLSSRFTLSAKFFSITKSYNLITDLNSSSRDFHRFFSKTISNQSTTNISNESETIDPCQLFELGSKYYRQKDFPNAVRHFQAGASKNHVDCMNAFALCLYNGHGVSKDVNRAYEYFQKSADKGHKESQYYCGIINMTGDGRPSDIQKAANYLKLSADQDYGNACFFYAYLLMGGTEAESNANSKSESETSSDRFDRTGKEAFKYLDKGSELGNSACQCAYGIALFQGENIQTDKKKGIDLIKKSCDQGYARALNFYGQLLTKGVTVFEKSKEGNNSDNFEASFPVCLVEKNEKLAAEKFAESASQFDPEGCYLFGKALLNGNGVQKNAKRALIFIKRSAQIGFPEAVCDLATFFEKGIEVEVDIQKAAALYKKAADLGSQGAAVHYAQLCMDGKGVKKNVEEAAKYFKLAMRKH